MIPTIDLLRWVKTLDPNGAVHIDDGGLTLIELDKKGHATDAYLEVGGEPDIYACADCGREFTDGDKRDDHFMSSDCPKHPNPKNHPMFHE